MKTLYFGGTILTMENPMYAESMLVEDGKILALGNPEALKSLQEPCELVNLHGRTLMPAFIDAHSHFTQVANAQLQASLDGAASLQEIRRRIQAFVQETGVLPGEWIAARDYDNNLFPGSQNPDLDQIDTLAPGYKLVLHHKSGHMGLLNTAALEELNITAQTPDPEGGRIGRQYGRLTGYMEENAFFAALKKMPPISMGKLMNAYRRAQQIYASHGIATMQEGMMVQEMLPFYRQLLQEKILCLDLVLYPSPDSLTATRELLAQSRSPHCRIGGIKIFLDGSPQGRTAWMRTPYLGGNANDCGYGTMTDAQVLDAFDCAARENVQLIAHCNGDAAAAQFLRCLERAEKIHPTLASLRPVIIHGQLMGVDQLAKAAKLGAVVSFFVAHVYHWGDVHMQNFGPERAQGISPAASAKRAGLPFTFHQDAPVISPDMLETIWCATNRTTRAGHTLGPQERISTLDALEAITKTAAWQYGEEYQKGTLSPGKQADFILLDANPLTIGKAALRSIQVLQTYKNGVLVFER